MAKSVTRKTLIQFGSGGPTAKFGQFGSLVAGAPINTKDIATIQALTAWINGLQDALYGANKAPLMEDFNSLLYVAFWQIFYMLQEGIPEWDAGTTYFIGAIVRAPGTQQVYQSLIDNNLNIALPSAVDNASWQYTLSVSTSKLIGLVLDAQISGMSASKLIGNVLDAQLTSPTTSKLSGLVLDAQINSLSASKLTGTLPAASVSTGTLNTATGSLSGFSNPQNVSMNDYTFFPNFTTQAGNFASVGFFGNVADTGTTVGRFQVANPNFITGIVRWRYVTGSDNPRIWAMIDKAGKIVSVWESEDPPNHGEMADDWGAEEMCPFDRETLVDGNKIVKLPVLNVDEAEAFISKMPQENQEAIAERFFKKMAQKKWVDSSLIKNHSFKDVLKSLPKHKQAMGAHWLTRAITGRHNTAHALHTISQFSENDGRLILSHEHAGKIEPSGKLIKGEPK